MMSKKAKATGKFGDKSLSADIATGLNLVQIPKRTHDGCTSRRAVDYFTIIVQNICAELAEQSKRLDVQRNVDASEGIDKGHFIG